MREIKFRAWNSEKKTMRIHDVVVCNGKQVIPVQTSGNDYWDATWEECENILMQDTGFLDTNGVKIYEGDIIKKHFEYDDEFELIEDIRFLPSYDLSKSEIVGNIYETEVPSLLTNE